MSTSAGSPDRDRAIIDRGDAPAFTIAMPVRNAGRWLAESIESVLAQSDPRFELIAVDDGSTDDSRRILEEYAGRDSRIRVLQTTAAAHGIACALNLALAAARAPILVRMDADDRMHHDRLRRQGEALARDPTLFAVASRAEAFPDEQVTDGMRAYLDWQNELGTPEEIARDRFIESPVLHPSVALRTTVLRRALGGWRDGPFPEDWDLFMRSLESGLRIARVPEVLLHWRLHERQATRTDARYTPDALLALRASYLARHLTNLHRSNRSLWVLGAGPVGKALVKALADHGIVADGLADVDPRKIGGIVRGAGHRWRVHAHDELRSLASRPFAISAVSGAAARARVRALMAEWGWTEGDDFIVAA